MGNGAPTSALPPEVVAADCDAVAALGAEQAAREARLSAAGAAGVDPVLADLEGADLEELRAHIGKYRQTAKMLSERITKQQKIKSVSQTVAHLTVLATQVPVVPVSPSSALLEP